MEFTRFIKLQCSHTDKYDWIRLYDKNKPLLTITRPAKYASPMYAKCVILLDLNPKITLDSTL